MISKDSDLSRISKSYSVGVVYAHPGSTAERVLNGKSGRSGPSSFSGLTGETLKIRVTVAYSEYGVTMEEGQGVDRDLLDSVVLEKVFPENSVLNLNSLFRETPITIDTIALTAHYAISQELNLSSGDIEVVVTNAEGDESYA